MHSSEDGHLSAGLRDSYCMLTSTCHASLMEIDRCYLHGPPLALLISDRWCLVQGFKGRLESRVVARAGWIERDLVLIFVALSSDVLYLELADCWELLTADALNVLWQLHGTR